VRCRAREILSDLGGRSFFSAGNLSSDARGRWPWRRAGIWGWEEWRKCRSAAGHDRRFWSRRKKLVGIVVLILADNINEAGPGQANAVTWKPSSQARKRGRRGWRD